MIDIKKITPPTVDLYSPIDEPLGTLNEYELLDALVQINHKQLTGYYLIFNERKVKIDRNGTLNFYPPGLLDTMSRLYLKLNFGG